MHKHHTSFTRKVNIGVQLFTKLMSLYLTPIYYRRGTGGYGFTIHEEIKFPFIVSYKFAY